MRNQPPCNDWAEKLILRRADLLPAECVALDTHLATCSSCATAYADYQFLDAHLRALPPPTMKRLPRLVERNLEEDEEAAEVIERIPSSRLSFYPRRGASHPSRPVTSFINDALSGLLVASLIIAALVLFRSIHSTNTGALKYEGGITPLNVSQLALAWVSSPTRDGINSPPAMANGMIYVGSRKKLYALDATSGQTRWVSSPTGDYILSPAVANGVAYAGSYSDKLYAFDATSGQTRWVSSPIGGHIHSSPTVANGVVYVGSYSGKLYAFDAASGQTRWVSSPTESHINSSPVVANGVVYVSSDDGKLYALDAASGQTHWVSPSGEHLGSPVVANGVVYASSSDGKVYAFHLPGTSP